MLRAHKLLFLLAISVTACSAQPTSTVTVQPDSPVAIPTARPLTLSPIQWQVMTLPELKKLVAQLEADHKNEILFSLDTTNYNNFSLNLVEMERYIKEQKAILTMLKTIITERSAQSGVPQTP